MLSKGDVGPAVKYLQAALNIHMFDCPDPLVVDGKFGPLTEARTALFQGRYDLMVDAVVGPLTTGALCTYAVSEQHLILGHSQTKRRGPYDVDRPRRIKPIPVSPRPYPFQISPTKTPDAPYIRFFRDLRIGFEGGQETRFSYGVSERRRETKLLALANVTGFWSRSIHKHVSLGLGIGYLFERTLQRQREFESKAYLFSRLQLKTFAHAGRFGLPVNFETQWVDPVGKQKAFCATLAVGPEISFFDERLTIALGGIGTLCAEGKRVTVSGSLGAKASLLFGDQPRSDISVNPATAHLTTGSTFDGATIGTRTSSRRERGVGPGDLAAQVASVVKTGYAAPGVEGGQVAGADTSSACRLSGSA